nr:alkaline phosphatase family protein [Sphingomonadaceae bacterium]
GDGRFARNADDPDAFRASPALDAATLSLAGDLVTEMRLGKGPATDLIAIGASSTDYVGHRFGTEGSEMCIQLTALDAALAALFQRLDASGVDYVVVLTADHGGHDAPERNREDAIPEAQRIDTALTAKAVGAAIGRELGLSGPVLRGAEAAGDVWIDRSVPFARRGAVIARAKALLTAYPQVAAVFSGDEIVAAAPAITPPETWTLLQRARASYDAHRSGDLIVLMRPRVTPIAEPGVGYIATHGSPWDYDRRVPMLFWRKGMTGFEQPNSVETVDIAPTLAALIGLPLAPGEVDGRCLDLIAGPASSCPSASRTP